MLLNTGVAPNVKLAKNSFPFFFVQFPDISMTVVKFPNITGFSREVVTLIAAEMDCRVEYLISSVKKCKNLSN